MKLGVVMLLSVGMCCSPVAAQQVLLALNPTAPFTAAVISPAARAADPALAELRSVSFYQAVLPHNGDAVCTQAISALHAHYVLQGSSYAFDRRQFSAAAMRASFSQENMSKMAHNFVPGQPLPDAPSYVPLTMKQEFEAFLRKSHSANLGVGILSDALISQATGAYPTLGGGWAGFGQRVGVSAAGAETAAFFSGFVYPTLFHQDPRYFPSHEDRILNRIAYAASRAFIGRSDNGMSVVNSSVIASQFTEAAIANAYVPYRHHSVGGTAENALIGIAGVAEGNILSEFWPDLKEFVWRRTHSRTLVNALDLGDSTSKKLYQ